MSFFGSSSSINVSAASDKDLINDITVSNPPEDSISDMAFSPAANFLSVSSWDKKNRIYEVMNNGSTEGRAMFEHDMPILTTRWSKDGSKVATGGCDKVVKLYDCASQQTANIGTHDSAVKSVRFVECGPNQTPCIVSGSWDKTIKYWDMRSANAIAQVNLPERVYCMDSAQSLLVVASAERHISVIDLKNGPDRIFKNSMSPLKWQTRTVSCFPSGNGFAVGSIEGRAAMQYVDDAEQNEKGFSFKCHRKTTTVNGRSESHIYPVNSIQFHPVYGTFSTAGGDGTFHFWDKDARQRLKAFPSVNSTISCTAFNKDGSIFAYAMSYDWSQGFQHNRPDYPNMIKLHGTKDEEVKQKPKKR